MHSVHPELRRKRKKAQLHPVHLDPRRIIISPQLLHKTLDERGFLFAIIRAPFLYEP